MAITQDRMIGLIREVELVKKTRDTLLADLRQAIKLGIDGLFTPAELADSILFIINQQHELSLPSYVEERAHFLKHEARNEKKKRFMEGQRRLQGTVPQAGKRADFSLPSPIMTQAPIEYPAGYAEMIAKQVEPFTGTSPTATPTPHLSGSGWKPLPKGATGDTIPDLSEYEAEPPDFKKGIF